MQAESQTTQQEQEQERDGDTGQWEESCHPPGAQVRHGHLHAAAAPGGACSLEATVPSCARFPSPPPTPAAEAGLLYEPLMGQGRPQPSKS